MEIILSSPNQAHTAIKSAWDYAKPQLFGGRKLILKVVDYEEEKTAQQRKFYHSYILGEIARQAKVEGNKYSMPTWKEFMRGKYLGDKVENVTNPMTGVITKQAVRVSTESLGVKAYSELIDKVSSFAATELNVNFNQTFDEWVLNEGL